MAVSGAHYTMHDGCGAGNGLPTALVIEDDLEVGQLLDELLTAEGAVVVRADGARSGLRLATEHQPDLILLDQRLPDGSGASVLAALRQNDATRCIPVIMLSAAPQATAVSAHAPDGFVAKPFDLDELLSEVVRFVPLVEGQG